MLSWYTKSLLPYSICNIEIVISLLSQENSQVTIEDSKYIFLSPSIPQHWLQMLRRPRSSRLRSGRVIGRCQSLMAGEMAYKRRCQQGQRVVVLRMRTLFWSQQGLHFVSGRGERKQMMLTVILIAWLEMKSTQDRSCVSILSKLYACT